MVKDEMDEILVYDELRSNILTLGTYLSLIVLNF